MDTKEYDELTQRNIGIISKEQQEKLKNSCVAIFGLGGLGGVIAENLVRCGIGTLKIIDIDEFAPVNLNRQIFAFRDTIGKLKTDVTEEFLKKINPEIEIKKYSQESEQDIEEILSGANAVVLAVDLAMPCVIISRAARKMGIPLVEGWATPIANVRVFTKDTPSLEEVYGLPSLGREISSIMPDEFGKMELIMLVSISKIEGMIDFYPVKDVESVLVGKSIPYNPTFAPMVWMNAILMSMETIKVLLNWGKISFAPKFSLYNPINHIIPKQ